MQMLLFCITIENKMGTLINTATILDTRREKKEGTFPVKLRLTFERKQQYYKTPFDLTKTDFEKVMYSKRLSEAEKALKNKITAFESKAVEVINTLPFFSWQLFEKQFYTNRVTKGTIKEAFENYAKDLRETGRIGTAVSYECANSSLSKFMKDAKFVDVTPEALRKYEKWMLTNGNSVTTVGIYLRSLRTLFNNAIAEGTLSKELYPFGKKKYEIPTGRNIKKALTLSDIALIYNYKAEAGTTTEKAKDLWFFMYLCNGINVKDLCLLKYENIKADIIEFERAKTARTKRTVEAIRVVITEDAKAIIEKWGNKNKDPKNYIFPVLEKGLTPTRERQLIQQLTQVINCHLRTIAKELEINNDLTTYAARHSFATVLKRSGVSTEFISEALGHNSLKTTKHYLASFEAKQVHTTTDVLTDILRKQA
jgi:hypothetical protein